MSYPRPDVPGSDPLAGKVIVARLLKGKEQTSLSQACELTLRIGGADVRLGPPDVMSIVSDLKTVLRMGLAGLDAEWRARAVRLLISSLEETRPHASVVQLARHVRAIHAALRDRLPASVVSEDQPTSIHIESLLQLDSTSFYVRGWKRDTDAVATHLVAVSPEGERVELLNRTFRYPRPDLDAFYGTSLDEGKPANEGFLSYFELPTPSVQPSGWIFEMHDAWGGGVEFEAPAAERNAVRIQDTLLGDIFHERWGDEPLLLGHLHPALQRLQARNQRDAKIETVLQFGRPPAEPTVSIVVPLYQRIDFLEQQLVHFADDPQLIASDLIYVLDSPELAEPLADIAERLFRLYGVPFRVALLSHNAGFSGANSFGASLARGRLLLLLNSDVLPSRAGWLTPLVEFYDTTPRIGALAPKLLYEDGSLQHAGLYFRREGRPPLWNNEHYFKGFARSLPSANVARPVPAVTAACMLVDRQIYEQVGGLRGMYVQGDYEDSDLCLRLAQQGRESWYLPQVELFHLEGQSYPSPLRQLTGRYNRWLHTHLWDEYITEVMTHFSDANTAVSGAQ